MVYIGDSRTEGLRDVNSDSKNTFICLSSMGYDWMLSTAFPQAESYASSGTAFVILMGVNDLYHQNSYISAINQKAAEWKKKGAVVYFASVGPVQNDPYTSNSEIESFNRALKNGLSSDVGISTCMESLINPVIRQLTEPIIQMPYPRIYCLLSDSRLRWADRGILTRMPQMAIRSGGAVITRRWLFLNIRYQTGRNFPGWM